MPRFLAAVETKLGVRFPDSYVDVFMSRKAISKFRFGELYAPARCTWLDGIDEHPSRTLLQIGMHLRGDARPLVMRRVDPAAAELEPTIYVLRGGLEQVAESLSAAFKPPPKAPTLEQIATQLLRDAQKKR